MQIQENEFDVPVTCLTLDHYKIKIVNSSFVGTYDEKYLEELVQTYLINSLVLKDLFKNINEQVDSTFVFDKPVNFSYYDYVAMKQIDICSTFFVFNGIECIDISPRQRKKITCREIKINLTDENLKTCVIKLNNVFVDSKSDVISSIAESFRAKARLRGAKMTFRRVKKKKSTKKSKIIQSVSF